MEIYERIRELRKKHLKMSADEFGQRLGVNRDMIYNIELNRLARPDQKTSLYKLICSEFRVNEDWLLNGNEPMFVQTPSSVMETLRQEFDLDDFSYSLVYEYLKLGFEEREIFRRYFYDVLAGIQRSDQPEADSPAPSPSPSLADAEAAYIKSRSSSAPDTDSAASSSTGAGAAANE